MCSKGQRYGSILSFALIFVLLFALLCNGSSILLDYLEAAGGQKLSINFDSSLSGLATFCFIFNYALMYLQYALPYGLITLALIAILCVLMDIIRYRKFTVLMGLTILSMVFIIAYGMTSQWLFLVVSLFIGLILFDQTYLLNKTYDSHYAFKGIVADYMALFVGFNVKDDVQMDLLHRQAMKARNPMVKPMYLTLINILLYLLTILTLGLAYGLTIHIKAKVMIKHLTIQNQSVIYQGKWFTWFIKGIKWWLFTVLTMGLYWLLGGITLDKADTLASLCHFDSDQTMPSFFDGTMTDFGWIHLFSIGITILSLGILYPIGSTMVSRYLINHTVIDGIRLVDGSSVKYRFFHWVWCYPLLILTLGLFHGYDQVGQLINANQKIDFDDDPYLYANDESFADSPLTLKGAL